MVEIQQGVVKWFDNSKDFGFMASAVLKKAIMSNLPLKGPQAKDVWVV